MNITLNQTNIAGLTWIYKIQGKKKNYTVHSSSKYLLYELTDNNLIITARKEANDGDNIVLVGDNNVYITYTLNKQNVPTTPNYSYAYQCGNVSSVDEIPTQLSGNSDMATDGVINATATSRIFWIALEQQLSIVDVIETLFGTSWIGDLVDKGTIASAPIMRMYYIDFGITESHTTNLKITYTK